MTKSPPITRRVPLLCSLHWLPVKFRLLFKISLLTYKTIHEKQPAHRHSMLAVSLPSCSLRSNKGISLSVPRVHTSIGTRAFHSCAPSLWNNLPLSVHSAISVATFKKHLKTHLFYLAFPHRHQHTRWPIAVTELFHWFSCWAPMRLSYHWAWLHWGYWHYRNLIDWI